MKYSEELINEVLIKAGNLTNKVIGIYATDEHPQGAVPVSSVVKDQGKCIAKAIVTMAIVKDTPDVYIGGNQLDESCWAASTWLGYKPMPEIVNNMMTNGEGTGREGFYLKDTIEICKESLADMGKITSPGKYIVARTFKDMSYKNEELLSVTYFGTSEQIRILIGLIHFGEKKIFSPVVAAWGSGCANFITYPAGLAENCPKDTAFLGPMGYEANGWFPENMLAISIPLSIVERIVEGYDRSFAAKYPEQTHPNERTRLDDN